MGGGREAGGKVRLNRAFVIQPTLIRRNYQMWREIGQWLSNLSYLLQPETGRGVFREHLA